MAQQLGISRPTAYELTKRAGFPALRVGKRIIVPVEAFKDWLADSSTNKERNNLSGR